MSRRLNKGKATAGSVSVVDDSQIPPDNEKTIAEKYDEWDTYLTKTGGDFLDLHKLDCILDPTRITEAKYDILSFISGIALDENMKRLAGFATDNLILLDRIRDASTKKRTILDERAKQDRHELTIREARLLLKRDANIAASPGIDGQLSSSSELHSDTDNNDQEPLDTIDDAATGVSSCGETRQQQAALSELDKTHQRLCKTMAQSEAYLESKGKIGTEGAEKTAESVPYDVSQMEKLKKLCLDDSRSSDPLPDTTLLQRGPVKYLLSKLPEGDDPGGDSFYYEKLE